MASKINKNKVIGAAQKYVQKGQYDRAIREYRKIVEEDPRDVRIWLKIGDLYAKKNNTQDAVDTYLKVAEFYSEQGFYLKAVAVYKQILKLSPALVDVNLKLAELYKQLGLLNDAMQQYELVSNHYHQQGRTKDALAAVRQIVDLDPENVASRIKLAELYSKEQMRDEAIEEFAKAADFLRAGNRIDDFVKVAERLIYHQSDNLPVTKELANLYLRRRDPRRALQKLQLAFKADPRDEHTLTMLAKAFEDLGQVAKTISVLKELAHIQSENGDEAKRQATFKRILALAPDDAEAQRALGQSIAPAPTVASPGAGAGAPPLPGPPSAAPPPPPPQGQSKPPAPPPGAMGAPPPMPPTQPAGQRPGGPPPLPPPTGAAVAPAPGPLVGPEAVPTVGAHSGGFQRVSSAPEVLDADQLDFGEPDGYGAGQRYSQGAPQHDDGLISAATASDDYGYGGGDFDQEPGTNDYGRDVNRMMAQQGGYGDEAHSGGYGGAAAGGGYGYGDSGYAPDGYDRGAGYEHSYQPAPGGRAGSSASPAPGGPPSTPDALGAAAGAVPPPGDDELPSYQPRNLEQSPGYQGYSTSPGADVEEEVARVLTEADVYIKYGLHDKAVDHLRQIFDLDPNNVDVRLKLRDVYMSLGRFADASGELYALATALARENRRAAAGYLNEALELDAANDPARELLGMLESGVQPAVDVPLLQVPQGVPGYQQETLADDALGLAESAIDLQAADIVEEITIDPAGSGGSTDVNAPHGVTSPGALGAPPPYLDGDDGYADPTDSGVLELRGEITDTLGGGTPSSDLIRLPPEQAPSGAYRRIAQEEEASGIEDDLEEADFFIQQNLFAEARAILEELSNRYPNHPLVTGKLADLEESEQRGSPSFADLAGHDSQLHIAAELAEELDGPGGLNHANTVGDGANADYSVEDVFNEFKRVGDDQVSDEDSDTHYDLGIAYREMGLLDDAIAEFKVAMRSREKEVLCHMMIGLCYGEKNMMSEAISQFKTGLYVEGITDRETIALYFELGQAYENLDDLREALYYYEKVGKKDPKFRDVASRIERIRRSAGGGGIAGGGGGQGPGGGGLGGAGGGERMMGKADDTTNRSTMLEHG